MITKTEAVVLHAMKYRDTSKIVTVYSKNFGKIKIIAKGTRNQRTNTFGSSLEPMTHSSIVIYKKEHGDLHLLSKSEIVTPLKRLQERAETMYSGLALVELVNMVMHDEEENETIFSLLVSALKTIDGSAKNSVNAVCSFMIQLFDQFGFGLNLESCISCGKKTGAQAVTGGMLRISDGTYTCADCSEDRQQSGMTISGGMVQSLRFLGTNPIDRSVHLSLSAAMIDDMTDLLQRYLGYHIDGARTLRSLSMLQKL